jgi:hypothetical protein
VHDQLWAGDPQAGGILLGEGREPALQETDPLSSRLLEFTTAPVAKATGELRIVIASVRTRAFGGEPFRYQQAEISDLRLEKIP